MKQDHLSKEKRSHNSSPAQNPFFAPDSRKKNSSSSKENGNLNSSVRNEMEHFFGESLSSVHLKQESIAGSGNLLAGAQGEDIVMDKMIPPESLLGKALLAHELTHVLQQRADASHKSEQSVYDTYENIESEANSVGWKFMNKGMTGFKLNEPVRRKSKRGQFHACTGSSIEAPAYLGPDSRKALTEINDTVKDFRILRPLIIAGIAVAHSDPAESAAQGGPGEDVKAGAEAAQAIPVIEKAQIIQIIELLMLDHQNTMNPQEVEFWRKIYQKVTGSSAPF
ncbi:MAG: eCIS core domain-containing protein [Ginsengibacter sp.]